MTSTFGRDPIQAAGPWRQRRISANGAQFHISELGEGPLVLLLHGFPEFWWAWRSQLPALADAGYRAVAMDLRGYGGSDKTPRGYDPATSAADVTAVVRSLGERQAVLVGHDWGSWVAWSAAVLRPAHVAALASLSMPHPLDIRRLLRRGGNRHNGVSLRSQIPFAPERALAARDGARVETLLRNGAADDSAFPDVEAAARYRAAMRLWPAPHCALEYQRWAFRSTVRADGRRFARRLEEPVNVPVLQIHGAVDPEVPLKVAALAREHVSGPYAMVTIPGVGHYPHEEAPEAVNTALTDWLREVRPT